MALRTAQSVDGALRAGNLLFIGGIGGWYKESNGTKPARPHAGDIAQQTTDALTIIKQMLEGAGSSLEQLLKVQVVLVDPEKNWAAMTEAYNAFFAGCESPMPVRNYIGTTVRLVHQLLSNAHSSARILRAQGFQAAKEQKQLVQIDCIAYVE